MDLGNSARSSGIFDRLPVFWLLSESRNMSGELSMRRQPCWLVRRTLETPSWKLREASAARAQSGGKGEGSF
jgi:hypothetical protein